MRDRIAINVIILIIKHALFDANAFANVTFGMSVRMKKGGTKTRYSYLAFRRDLSKSVCHTRINVSGGRF